MLITIKIIIELLKKNEDFTAISFIRNDKIVF